VAGEALSALIDGEADANVVGRACAAWRDQPATRSEWHTYHLIGDVMRSDDLASAPDRDAAFLARLRVRLADEPVVLAPAPVAPATRLRMRPRRWAGPVAVAAGFVAVAGVLVVMRATAPVAAEATVAGASPDVPSGPVGATPALASTAAAPVAEAALESERLVRGGTVLRDARLDRYLAAHKQFAGSSALGVPSSFLRSATVDAAAGR
jgi:sigma-E factor negative regulatory protein RseA